jgi:hypothetical protein
MQQSPHKKQARAGDCATHRLHGKTIISHVVVLSRFARAIVSPKSSLAILGLLWFDSNTSKFQKL